MRRGLMVCAASIAFASTTVVADPDARPVTATDCQHHVVAKEWTEVETCALALAKTDRAAATKLQRLAVAEIKAETAAKLLFDAVAVLHLREATKHLATIPRTSVYHAGAKASIDAAQPKAYVCTPGSPDRADGSCRCPLTHSAARDSLDNAICKVDRCRDTAALAKLEVTAREQVARGEYGRALASYDAIIPCQPQVARAAAHLTCKHLEDWERVKKRYGALLSPEDLGRMWDVCHPCRAFGP